MLLNRCQKRPIISPEQIEELIGVPVQMTFPNDYQGVHRALTLGRWVEPNSELGNQFSSSGAHHGGPKRKPPVNGTQAEEERFLEYFSVMPPSLAVAEQKNPAV